MKKKFHGIYKHIAATYEEVLHLIGEGYQKEDIVIIMSPTILVSDALTGRRSRERRQKSLLESVFPLRHYSPETFLSFSPEDQALIKPYQEKLEQGYILILIIQSEASTKK